MRNTHSAPHPRQIAAPNPLQTQGKPPGFVGDTLQHLHDGSERGAEEKPHSKESREGGPWAGGKFLLLKMLREGRRSGGGNQIQLEGTGEVEEGKGEEGEEEGEKGEWEAGEEGCSPSPGELEGGQPEDWLQGGYKRQDGDAEGPAAPRGPAKLLRWKPGGFSPRRQKQPSRSGDAASHAPGSWAQGQLRMVPKPRPALLLLLLLLLQAFLLWDSLVAASIQEQYCESLPPVTNHTGPQCNASVDLIGTCWPRSAVGQLVARPCPEFFYGVRYNTTNNGYRECLANGSWAARVNYSQCQEILSEEKKSKLHYHIAVIINYLGHCVSLGALLVAFVLFMRLRSIRCLRNIIHWNLITAFILRNATWFVVQLTMNPEVHESNVVWCRLVTAAYNYFHVTNFFWMFGEGCYLHTAIVLTYSTDKLRKWMFICIGWCIPFPIIVAWAIGKLYYDNEKCWFGKRAGVYTDYIYQGPMILVLLINFIFLFNIVRILMTKLRASTTSETIQYRKAVKATLVLLPLLGITYMLFFVNPGEDEISRIVFIYFNSLLESFQGFFVSVFYCFLNSEECNLATCWSFVQTW
uniref:Corticotropin-releasing factor receptor 1 n=2 Tax=Cyanistes caeruleus TaxID=156563 RepID=A0A8C0VJE6_CYACU